VALQLSGIISLNDIQSEFGGSDPVGIDEYYRGGVYVPDIVENESIPTSGLIGVSDFYRATRLPVITVTEGTASNGSIWTLRGYAANGKHLDLSRTGFDSGGEIGSRVASTFDGITIQGLYEHYAAKSTDYWFVVVLAGTHAKSLFTSINVQGKGTLNSASATHAQFSSSTIWRWNTGNISQWDGVGTSTVTFTP